MLSREAVLRKIRALRAMAAPTSGATASERAIAQRLAEELQAKYQVSADEKPAEPSRRWRPRPEPVYEAFYVHINGSPLYGGSWYSGSGDHMSSTNSSTGGGW